MPSAPSAFTVVSTFSGCGGSSLGYKAVGGRVLLAVEQDAHAVETYRLNFPDTPVFHGDIHDLSGEEAAALAGVAPGELDVLDGSPPCQGFSTARGKRDVADERNLLFEEYVRLLRHLRPRAFVMENVSGMVKGEMKAAFDGILAGLRGAGYAVAVRQLNAAWYGVPQSRERLIFVGARADLGISPGHPPPTASRSTCAADALRGLRASEAERAMLLAFANTSTGAGYPWWAEMPADGTPLQRVLSAKASGVVNYGFTARKLHPGKPCPTITKTDGNLGLMGLLHWAEKRKFTVGELMRFAGFPDSFRWPGNTANKADYKRAVERIGNCVPPGLMAAVAAHVRDTIVMPARAAGR
jgi:DNA (cytosine-5)-methyltransferase 1